MTTQLPTQGTRRPARPTATHRPLPPPRASGSTGHALLQGAIALGMALCCGLEAPRGYTFPVFHGPESVMAWLPGTAWHDWAVIFAAPALCVLLGRGRPRTLYPLAVLAVAWSLYGGAALRVGITSDQAACTGGLLQCGWAVAAWLDVAALARRLR